MATAADGIDPYENFEAGEKSHKRHFEPENSTGKSSDEGENSAITPAAPNISELEQMLKQATVTRFKIQHPATMEDLPDELLTNIFIRLLARQLAQMRTVSKYWNALLSHPSFIKSHLRRCIHYRNNQVLLVFPLFYGRFSEYSCKSTHLEPINFLKHVPTYLPMRVIGAVNGLICLSSECPYSNLRIWNPSLSAVSTIPSPHPIRSTSHSVSTSVRFGFDPKTDDYKLVRISCIRNYCSLSAKEWLEVDVYSRRKGSWKFIAQPFPSHITWIFSTDHLCVDGHDGHLHWEAKTGLSTSSTIVAFDLGSETFHEIPFPDSMLDSNDGVHYLGVLAGKLCVTTWHKDGGWEVWVMEEYGVPESWVKSHVLSQFTGGAFTFRLSGFTLHSELLLSERLSLNDVRQLVLYDPITNKSRTTLTRENEITVVEYVDSLVWV